MTASRSNLLDEFYSNEGYLNELLDPCDWMVFTHPMLANDQYTYSAHIFGKLRGKMSPFNQEVVIKDGEPLPALTGLIREYQAKIVKPLKLLKEEKSSPADEDNLIKLITKRLRHRNNYLDAFFDPMGVMLRDPWLANDGHLYNKNSLDELDGQLSQFKDVILSTKNSKPFPKLTRILEEYERVVIQLFLKPDQKVRLDGVSKLTFINQNKSPVSGSQPKQEDEPDSDNELKVNRCCC